MEFKHWLFTALFCLAALAALGQTVVECPQNIGFEKGTFANWQCLTGEISETTQTDPGGVITLSPSGSINGRHTVISDGVDEYGDFSLKSPNGSKYVIKLGNNEGGRGAEGISYTLKVPANAPTYSVIFNYALVLQNPGHPTLLEQPRFIATVINETTNTTTPCGSFTFIAASNQPGFSISAKDASVTYKPWSAAAIDLSAYQGHTVRLEFTTNDCTHTRHFGYAYLDFAENCSAPISGAAVCTGDRSTVLSAVPGFERYRWYKPDTQEELGTTESITLSPVPPPGTRIAVDMFAFPGLGCDQTLVTTITGVALNVNPPQASCYPVDLTATAIIAGSTAGLTYTYWKDAALREQVPDPRNITASGTYYLQAQAPSGCKLVREVDVIYNPVLPIEVIQQPQIQYPATLDLGASFLPDPRLTYSYWLDTAMKIPIREDPHRVRFGGDYYLKGVSSEGCTVTAKLFADILVLDIDIPNVFTPNGDGINDVLTVDLNRPVDLNYLKIYNRWGALVFQTRDITNFWTGRNQNGSNAPGGTYYWVIDGKENLMPYKRSGAVTLVR
ncbi:gliding motility-associated C-terminal domain-containing protein [Hufsiella ginkgonis]|uniref:T9SS type B sorting domain-containing protein n=1 Tax=Hufsiella ginkgonis TaxID=2695274 RepID=A0A7K1XZJ2_9SPHI|nr:gliding motility-associated C-terminal domain-containing protein [Hufsiella ginkgonis]MXV16434.1 T9SS type B sorting domain-containing protein [Hufsiella ginkgonis]